MKRLFIIDVMAMAFRHYHAFGKQQLTTSQGVPTSAIFGSSIFLLNLIEEEKPDYLFFALDSKEPTFRHEIYTAYKANRTEMPEDLAKQLPFLFRLFDCLGFQTIRAEKVEADDLIGSAVKTWAREDLDCYIVSGDKDFMQLINDHVFLYSPKKGEKALVIDRKGVLERFSCLPSQVIDMLSLMGDSADNVPGVSGIGEKGAAKLISAFGSLEAIYENLDKIANKKQQESLRQGKEDAFLARRLVTIKCDVPLGVELDRLAFHGLDEKQITLASEFFKEMEFYSLVNRLKGKDTKIYEQEKRHVSITDEKKDLDHHYVIANSQDKIREMLSSLREATEFCIDTETTGLDIILDRPIGISFSLREKSGFYLPLIPEHLDRGVNLETYYPEIKGIVQDKAKIKIGHNLKFDLQMLKNIGLEMEGPFVDTMICSYLLDPNGREHGLDACCLRFLNYKKISLQSLVPGKGTDIFMKNVPLNELANYAIEDADLTLRLAKYLVPKIKEEGLAAVFQDIEMPLVPILAKMEQAGVYIDVEILKGLSLEIQDKEADVEKRIYQLAGEEFNINSPKQLQVILYDKLKIPEQLNVKRIKKTKTGYSTDISVLEKLDKHPLPAAILEYRMLNKLKTVYVDVLPTLVNSKTGRVHTSYHQTGTATGRLSSSEPNLQNIPVRSELGRKIRLAFCAQDKNELIVSADYSQIELRLLAHLAKDEGMIGAFRSGQDIHRATAARIFLVDQEQVTQAMRSRAKAINFGIIYGMGPQRLSREISVSMSEAKDFIERYFFRFPQVKNFIENSISSAREMGFSSTMTGRKRPIPEISTQNGMDRANAENIAVNSPVQGGAADLIKIAMINLEKELKNRKLKTKMILQVHDELVFEVPKEEFAQVTSLIKTTMEGAMNLDVPLSVDVGHGDNWLEAH